MRQVPHYAIIGDGRLVKHICCYFAALGLAYQTWARRTDDIRALSPILAQSTHVLLLISDKAIDEFIETHLHDHQQTLILVHCSGNLISKYAHSAHPLQTFGHSLYSLEDYQKIPFIITQADLEFSEVLPGLNNAHYKIKTTDKAYYHALCVLANNFTTILWQKFFAEMQNKFGVGQEVLQPFLQQTFNNISNNLTEALTGPIARKDHVTLQRDLQALTGDQFQPIFASFVRTFLQNPGDKP